MTAQQEMGVVPEVPGPFSNEDLLEFLGPLLDEDCWFVDVDDVSNTQHTPPPRLTLAGIQAAGEDPVEMAKGEQKAPPMPQHDILLGSHHYCHRTVANNVADSEVRPYYPREDSFNVQTFMEAVHEANQAYMPGTPFPKAWIGADKVKSEADYDPDTQLCTFAVGNVGKQDKRYTVVQASADYIRRDHNEGKGRWNKRRKTSHRNGGSGGSNGSGSAGGSAGAGSSGRGGAGSAGASSNSSGSTMPTTGSGSSDAESFGGSQQGNNSNQAGAGASAAELAASPSLQSTHFEDCRQHSAIADPQCRLTEDSLQRPTGLNTSALTTTATEVDNFNIRTAMDDDTSRGTKSLRELAKPTRAIVTTWSTITGRSGGPPAHAEGQVLEVFRITGATEQTRSVVAPMSEIEVTKEACMSGTAPVETLTNDLLRLSPQAAKQKQEQLDTLTASHKMSSYVESEVVLGLSCLELAGEPLASGRFEDHEATDSETNNTEIELVSAGGKDAKKTAVYSCNEKVNSQEGGVPGAAAFPTLGECPLPSTAPKKTTQHPEHRLYTPVQPPSNVRMIQQGEQFAPLPQYDVLLSSPHRSYLTKANRAYIELNAPRSKVLNVKTDVKNPLHRALKQTFGKDVPAPKFWIGADKVKSKEDWKQGSMRTFAVGKKLDKCYTVYEATDRCIVEENCRNSKGMKRSDEAGKDFASFAMDQAVNMIDGDAPQTNESATPNADPSPATGKSMPGRPHQVVLFDQGGFSNGNMSNKTYMERLRAVRSSPKSHHERRSLSSTVRMRSFSLEAGFKSLHLSDRVSPVGTIEELEGTIDNVLLRGQAEQAGLSRRADPPQERHMPNNHVASLLQAYQGPLQQLQVLLPDSEPQKDVEPPDIFLVRDFGSEKEPTQAYALVHGKEPINLSHGSRHSDWGCLFFGVICRRVGPRTFQATLQQVAIKRLNKRVVHEHLEKGGQENPYKEAARMQELGDNENVLQLVEFLEDDNYLYIVTPKAIGTLADFIEWGDPSEVMEPRRVRQIFFKILKILQYLESRGISHRDLSPSNFLFLTEDNLVVFDLAMSIRIPKDQETGQRCLIKPQGRAGTLSFMAPEVHENQAFDGAAIDLWSAATILYSLLTNQLLYKRPSETDRAFSFFIGARGLSRDPWNEKSQTMLEAMQNAGDPDAIRKLCDQAEAHNYISEDGITLLENLLAVDPAQRYTLSQALQSDFFQGVPKEKS